MKAFLSSTFLDLVEEREAVLEALHKKRTSTLAMEYFVAPPSTPRETALEKLRGSDVMILVIGFKAGTLLPDGSGSTYTSAEYDELLRLGKEPLVFVKQKPRGEPHLTLDSPVDRSSLRIGYTVNEAVNGEMGGAVGVERVDVSGAHPWIDFPHEFSSAGEPFRNREVRRSRGGKEH